MVRQQAQDFASIAVSWVRNEHADADMCELALYEHARLAAHFGRLATTTDVMPIEWQDVADDNLAMERQLDAARQRIAALEAALDEAIEELEMELRLNARNANEPVIVTTLTRLRAVLDGKDV